MSASARHRERVGAGVSLVLLMGMLGVMAFFSQRPQFELEFANAEVDAKANPAAHAHDRLRKEVDERFQQAVAMLHAKQYDYAVKALHRVIELAPRMPEAYVNMGYALIGLQNYKAAHDFFNVAIELRPYQANAYWGLAVTLEQMGDLQGALGAMRTYIHLSPPNDPHVRQARSALWEWESSLNRGPLPAAEKEWIEQRGREWEERNGPEVDAPAPRQEINLSGGH